MDLTTFQERTKDDHRKWVFGLENVVIYPAPHDEDTQFPVLNAKRFHLQEDQLIQGQGAYGRWDREWYVWQSEVDRTQPSYRFKPGDAIKDTDGLLWTVLTDEWDRLTLSWHMTCRNIVLHAELRDSITIIRGRQVKGAASQVRYDYDHGRRLVTNMPARVQPLDITPEDRMDVGSSARKYQVVCAQDVRLILAQDQIRATIGVTGEQFQLRWLTYRNAERIDELPILECERM